jgi:integrase
VKGGQLTGQKTRRNLGYGSIYRRGNFWTIDFKDSDGKRVQRAVLDALTYEDALFALQQEITKAFQVNHGQRPKRASGFREFAKVFLTDYMMVSRRNFKSDRFRLEALKEFFEDVDLRQITPLQCERLRKARLEKGNAKATVNRFLALLKRLFTIAIQEGYAEENPVKKIKLFSERDTLKERLLKPEEEERLLASSSGHLKPILIMALNSGARLGEIINLTWSCVDLEQREIRFEGCKSGRLRYVPMNQTLYSELVAWKSMNGFSPLVFPSPKTGSVFTSIKTGFLASCRRSNIQGLRFHDLRHSFATRLVQRGCDVETLRGLLGHRDLSTTQRYLHSSDERKREAVRLLEKTEARDGMVTEEKGSSAIH